MRASHATSTVLALAVSLALGGCTKPTEAPQAGTPAATSKDAGETVATVNGKGITLQAFNQFLTARRMSGSADAADPALVLNEMINRELVKQDAQWKGIPDRADFKQALEARRDELLINTMVAEKRKAVDLSDAALKKEYDAQIKELDLKEYKARHILVDSEDEAKAIIADLKAGKATFEALAKEKSKDPSGAEGGDLGWFPLNAVVPEFGEAVKALDKGKITEKPVKSQFGWHVIKFEDSRVGEAPKLEEVRDQLKMVLTNKALQEYVAELRKSAKIELSEDKLKPAGQSVSPSDAKSAGEPAKAEGTPAAR